MRLGGSSWELKIEPKRPQERIKNDFEEQRTRRGEKKGNKDNEKRPSEFPKCFDGVWPSNSGSPRKRKVEQFGRLRPPGSRHVSKIFKD